MMRQILTVCLLATLLGAARAESAPVAEAPDSPAAPSTLRPRPALEVQRQALEEARKELEAEFQRLAAEMDAEAQRSDSEGRLTSDQLFELLQAREQRRDEVHFDPMPALVSASLFGSLLTGFLAWLFAGYRKTRQLHETVRLMVEKGVEIPEGLLAPPPRRKPSDLRRGIILSTAGLGLAIFLAVLPDVDGAWGAGVTLFLIGLGHLLVWRLQTGKGPLSSALSPEPQP